MTIPLSVVWAIEPGAARQMVATLAAGIRRPILHADVAADPPAGRIHVLEPGAVAVHVCPAAGPATDAARDGLPMQVGGGVALIDVTGPLLKDAGWLSYFGFGSTRDIRRAVEAAAADDDVETIVLRIDSPGGTTDGIAEVTDAVAAAARGMPVVAQVDGMAASAAYWIASQATTIVAQRMDMVGSIGVRMLLYDFSQAFANEGVEAVPIDTGPFKSAGAVGTEITEEQRADFQRVVDAYMDAFRTAVMAGRSMSADAFAAVADGRLFTAAEALSLGLIDRVGTVEDTLAQAAQPDPPRRVRTGRAASAEVLERMTRRR